MQDFRQWVINESKQTAIAYHVSPVSGLYKLRPTGFHSGYQDIPQHQQGVYVTLKFKYAVGWAINYVAYIKGKHKGPKYKNLTIYKLEIPKDILQTSWHHGTNPDLECFITETDAINIISSKTYSYRELSKLFETQYLKSREHQHLNKSKDDIAKSLRLNYAAQEYLRLKEKIRQAVLSNKYKTIKIHILQQNLWLLEPYFVRFNRERKSLNEPIERVNPEDLVKVKQIVANIELILTQTDRE